MEERRNLDVLICGAGACGLVLALDLARRDVRFRIIEKNPRPFPGSRGKGLQPRTLEVFEDLGVLDRVVAAGGSYPPLRSYDQDGRWTDQPVEEAGPASADRPYLLPVMVPQFLTERILRERLGEFGERVDFGCELTDFKQDASGVTARLQTDHGVEHVRASYLVGADGGRSFVRRALKVGFPGQTLGVRAIVADVSLRGLDRAVWSQFNAGRPDRLLMICPLRGTDLFQIQAPIGPAEPSDLSVDGLQHMVRDRTGQDDIEVEAVAWASAYAMNARLADHYRIGRVLLSGDAAHIHPPTGGQGLNTSVQDAYNLGWKLAAVLRGAPDRLLDTYAEERRPIAAQVLGLSRRLLDGHGQKDSLKRGPETQQLDIGYLSSSLSLEGRKSPGLVPAGARMPDALLIGAAGQKRRLFDVMAGPQWTLLRSTPIESGAAPARAGIRTATVGSETELRDPENQLGLQDGQCLLIRPDGYVGAAFDADADDRVKAYLDEVVGPSSPPEKRRGGSAPKA